MKTLQILKYIRNNDYIMDLLDKSDMDEAIAELEALQQTKSSMQNLIDTAIEEIEYALAKPQYADVYLNNAIRFLNDNK